LDRLLAAMEELKMLPTASTPAEVLMVFFDEERRNDYLHLAAQLRAAGIAVELYPEAKKVGQQLKYADRRGFPVALIAGPNEFNTGIVQLKHLASGRQQEAPIDEHARQIAAAVRGLLGRE
jgi:histidyl-tRNA synthetase